MTTDLSDFFRTVLSGGKDFITIGEEETHIRSYLKIQKIRYEDILDYEISIEPALRERIVLKMILQPIVENAYVHGIKPKKGKGCIMIETAVKDRQLEISVMDNGVGMDGEEITKILWLFESDEPGIKNEYNWQSIGLKNVHDRIRFLYGEEYGIRITSTQAVGTMVRILLPLQRNEDSGWAGDVME